jgi:hypothetical protein
MRQLCVDIDTPSLKTCLQLELYLRLFDSRFAYNSTSDNSDTSIHLTFPVDLPTRPKLSGSL